MIQILELLLACTLAQRTQEASIRQSAASNAKSGLESQARAIGSAGIDIKDSPGHIRGIEVISSAGSESQPVTNLLGAGNTIGPTLTYTCDATINAVPGVCNALNTTIAALYTSRFTNVNASIYITFGSTGLGQSQWVINTASYTAYRSALNSGKTDNNDLIAYNSSVPSANPINPADGVWLTNPNARALGFAAGTGIQSDGATFCTTGTAGCYDGIITVSSSEQAGGHLYFRSGSITAGQYDFYSVVEHETDEILGTASCAISGCSSAILPADLYRYQSNGTRSFAAGNNNSCASSNSGNACFSIDGVHMLQQYNNLANGGDSGDWAFNCTTPLVQDAFACPGVGGLDVSLAAELLVLDVVGYNLNAPQPRGVLRDTSSRIRLTTYPSAVLSNAGGPFASDPSVAEDSGGNVVVAVRDSSNIVWANVFDPATQSWGTWASGGGAMVGITAITVTPNGTAWITGRDSSNAYWLVSYTAASGYGSWIPLHGSFADDPVISACGDGSLYIAGKDSFTAMWSGHYIPGTGFQNWVLFGGVVAGRASITCGGDNAMYLVARDNSNSNWIARVSGNMATGWFNGGAQTTIDPRIATLGNGSEAVVILDGGGSAWRSVFAEGAGNGWQTWTNVGGSFADVAAAGAAGELFLVGRSLNNNLWWWRQTGSQFTALGDNGVAAGALAAAPK